MPTIPLPFVVALLLIILLVRVIVQGDRVLRPTVIFISICILLVILGGLRWTVDLQIVRFLQPVFAALLPAIAWLCFAELGRSSSYRKWPHFVPAAIILVLSATWQKWHAPIDLILVGLEFAYGFQLLRRARMGTDGFEKARLADVAGAQRAALLAGWLLLFSGAVDLLIAGDFYWYQGRHAISIVGTANIITLPLLAYAIVVLGRSVSEPQLSEDKVVGSENVSVIGTEKSAAPTYDDERTMLAIEAAMQGKRLFRDPDLSLSRLSRKLGIPTRQISSAVNRARGHNVSQFVNEYRIREAQRLLRETDLPITSVMFECGFYTKSNFNREFARIAGMPPRDYRCSTDFSNI